MQREKLGIVFVDAVELGHNSVSNNSLVTAQLHKKDLAPPIFTYCYKHLSSPAFFPWTNIRSHVLNCQGPDHSLNLTRQSTIRTPRITRPRQASQVSAILNFCTLSCSVLLYKHSTPKFVTSSHRSSVQVITSH